MACHVERGQGCDLPRRSVAKTEARPTLGQIQREITTLKVEPEAENAGEMDLKTSPNRPRVREILSLTMKGAECESAGLKTR